MSSELIAKDEFVDGKIPKKYGRLVTVLPAIDYEDGKGSKSEQHFLFFEANVGTIRGVLAGAKRATGTLCLAVEITRE